MWRVGDAMIASIRGANQRGDGARWRSRFHATVDRAALLARDSLIKSKFIASTPEGHKLREAIQNVRENNELWIATALRASR
jgi:hypothetical protein